MNYALKTGMKGVIGIYRKMRMNSQVDGEFPRLLDASMVAGMV
jgi:hypothetical protein